MASGDTSNLPCLPPMARMAGKRLVALPVRNAYMLSPVVAAASLRFVTRAVPKQYPISEKSSTEKLKPRGTQVPRGFFRVPDRIRTCGLQSRSLSLYPAELQVHTRMHLLYSMDMGYVKSYLAVQCRQPTGHKPEEFFILQGLTRGRGGTCDILMRSSTLCTVNRNKPPGT